ncbi:DUF881 domain-containing protein [Planomicrobium sp. CPCC 101110]|uniref:DUF881 domain-containing protein n=1 Tax=Planomicrobium sp. CPCC 101110 TaxID=2599619 RepID=UPI0011B368D4|nr:DUF881 domain-containing protein [Planomicrobium sp. CPCC 101110]TWT28105.1 DUF881 domain-containing protein [Planomicrobium sp. CPCC 101110]
MKKSPRNNRSKFSKSIIFSLVFLVLGFMFSYSYSLSKSQERSSEFTGGAFFEQEEQYRKELIEQQERNKALREELEKKQAAVQEFEQSFSEGESRNTDYAEEAEELRRVLGLLPVEGSGLTVTLQDGEYNPSSVDPNDYIVHESHIFQVINELYISGAEAVSINGQRIHANSHIVCTGPVITVDGVKYPAPFTIAAIGKPDVLASSIKLPGGVMDQLVNDNVVVTLDEGQTIFMPAFLTES